MRILGGLLCILLLAAGCSEKDNIPSGVIGKDQMGEILWDMMQADQYAANYLIKDSSKVNVKMETLKLYEEVFRLHKVSRDEFRKSFQFYQDHPDITRVLFDSLIARGNRMRADSYTHPPVTTPTAPVANSPIKNPTFVPAPAPVHAGAPAVAPAPGTKPGRPAETFPNRPGGALPGRPGILPNRRDSILRNRPGGVLPNKPGGTLLNRPGGTAPNGPVAPVRAPGTPPDQGGRFQGTRFLPGRDSLRLKPKDVRH